MKPISKFSQRLAKTFIAAAIVVPFLLPPAVEARVLSGSVTERKTNRKITSMLKSARKNFDSGKVQQALDAYWKILELDPHETFAYLELGEIYVNLRIYDRAIELLEPGLTMAQREMDRETICYYFCILTQAHLSLNQTGEANKSLIKAAEASPQNPMPRKILGDIYLANNRIADAFKAYKKAVELDPEYQEAKEKLGELTAQYGDSPQSRPKDKTAISQKAVKLPTTKAADPKIAPKPQPATIVTAAPAPDKSEPSTAVVAPNADDITPLPMPKPVNTTPIPAAAKTDRPQPVPASATVAPVTERPRPVAVATQLKPSPEATPTASATVAAVTERPRPLAVATATTATGPATNVASATPAANADAPSAETAQIEEQIDKLLAGTTEEKKAATSFFVKLEEKGLTEIEELLYDSDPEVRIIAIRILPEFKAFNQRVKTMLNDASEDPDPSVIEEINKALQALEQ